MKKGVLPVFAGFAIVLFALLFTTWYPEHSFLAQLSEVEVTFFHCYPEFGARASPSYCRALQSFFETRSAIGFGVGTRYLLLFGVLLGVYGLLIFFGLTESPEIGKKLKKFLKWLETAGYSSPNLDQQKDDQANNKS